MQWSRVVMNLRLGRRANAATRIVEKDNQLLALTEFMDTTETSLRTDRGGFFCYVSIRCRRRRRIGLLS